MHAVRALLALAVLCCAPGTALAHGGTGAAYTRTLGPYVVYVYDGRGGEPGEVDYKLVVTDARTKAPVYDVTPQVRATRGSSAPVSAEVMDYGNVFYVTLPNPYPDRWDVRLRLTGRLGSGRTRFALHGVTPDPSTEAAPTDGGNRTTWLVVLGAAAVVVLGGAGLLVRRRR